MTVYTTQFTQQNGSSNELIDVTIEYCQDFTNDGYNDIKIALSIAPKSNSGTEDMIGVAFDIQFGFGPAGDDDGGVAVADRPAVVGVEAHGVGAGGGVGRLLLREDRARAQLGRSVIRLAGMGTAAAAHHGRHRRAPDVRWPSTPVP